MFVTPPGPPTDSPDDRIRFYVALILVGLFAILCLATPFLPAAATVLKEVVMPVLALIVGYLFGQRVRSGEP